MCAAVLYVVCENKYLFRTAKSKNAFGIWFCCKEDRMGNQLEWQDRFNIGVELIDREHRKLFIVINKLLEFRNQDGKSQWVCQEGIKYFK